MSLTWQIFAFGSAFFAALTAILGKFGVQDMNSNLATFIRTIVIVILSGVLITSRNEWVKPENLSAKGSIFLILSGVATGLSWLCYYRALKMGPVSKVASVDKLSVVLVVFFALLFLGESLTWKVALGSLFIGVGALLMVL